MTIFTVALALLLLSPAGQTRTSQSGEWQARLTDSWVRNNDERWVSLQLERDDDRRWGISIRMAELEGLAARGDDFTGDARFTVRRDAGTIDFEGRFDNGRGRGSFRFTANQDYVTGMRRLGYDRLGDDDLFRLATLDVHRTFVTSIQEQGYKSATLDEVIRMRIHGVDAEYIRAFRQGGYDRLSIEELVRTRIHGATPRFIQDVKSAGIENLSVDDLVKMRIHGVTPDFIRRVARRADAKPSTETLVKMRIHGEEP
jgi:hypothetical protein